MFMSCQAKSADLAVLVEKTAQVITLNLPWMVEEYFELMIQKMALSFSYLQPSLL